MRIHASSRLVKDDAVIEDGSVGHAFVGTDGIRLYFEQFFVSYSTVSKLLSLEQRDDFTAVVRIDFTGHFGHEIGILKIEANAEGLCERIQANLE